MLTAFIIVTLMTFLQGTKIDQRYISMNTKRDWKLQ